MKCILCTWYYINRRLLSLIGVSVLSTWSQMSPETAFPRTTSTPLLFIEHLLCASTSISILHELSHSILRTIWKQYKNEEHIIPTLRKLEFNKINKSAQGYCPRQVTENGYKPRCVSEACALSFWARFLFMNFTCGYNFIISALSHKSMKQEDKIWIPIYDELVKKMKLRGFKQQNQHYALWGHWRNHFNQLLLIPGPELFPFAPPV